MIQKSSIVVPTDKCGIFTGNAFHIYKGFKKNNGFLGDFVKISIRSVSPDLIDLKGQKTNCILVRSKKHTQNIDGSNFICKNNSVVCLKKRLTPRGKEIVGPASYKVKRKKFLSSFSGIF